jgi:hypothetical protein
VAAFAAQACQVEPSASIFCLASFASILPLAAMMAALRPVFLRRLDFTLFEGCYSPASFQARLAAYRLSRKGHQFH